MEPHILATWPMRPSLPVPLDNGLRTSVLVTVIITMLIIIISLQAMLGWGETLRKWYGRSVNVDRQPDISSDYIGYYTDNGNINY